MNVPIEEAKNADAEDDTAATFSPKAISLRGVVKLNSTLSGENRDPRRESNGLGNLMKKVRNPSINPTEENPLQKL